MQKVVAAALNARYTHSNLALRYLRQSVQHLPLEFNLIEFTINQPVLDILATLLDARPDYLLLSVYIWNSQIVCRLLPEIKKILPTCTIVAGGPEVSYTPDDWLQRFPHIDHIICGAGELALPALLSGAVRQPVIRMQPPAFTEVAFPYTAADFPELKDRYIYYESSRGCCFRCSYCLSSREDLPVQFRPLEQVFTELDWFIQRQVRIIKFIDRTFNASPQRARDIWQWIIQRNPATRFHFEIHPELLQEADFALLATAPKGLFQFEIGIQSTNPATLQAINRSQHHATVAHAIGILRQMNTIHLHTDLIAGLPCEDFTTFRTSFNKVFALGAEQLQLGFLKVLPGTQMAEQATEFGIQFLSSAPYEVLSTRWLTATELNHLRQIEAMIDMYHNSGAFARTIQRFTELIGDAFATFDTLVTHAARQDVQNQRRNWEKNAALLLETALLTLPEHAEELLDCLRWDWCLQANSHHYPAILRADHLNEAKRRGQEWLRQHKVDRGFDVDTQIIDHSAAHRAIFFIPLSNAFCQRFDLGNCLYGFFPAADDKLVVAMLED